VWKRIERPADSYGLVLVLVVLAYIVISINSSNAWLDVCIVALQGLTLFFALRTSHARHIWVLLAGICAASGIAIAILDTLIPGTREINNTLEIIGGILLLVTPIAIGRRLSLHTFVTTQTLLGAICVYVLIGFSFSSIYQAISFFGHAPFFTGVPSPTRNDYLFFSYTTLTTVGYGNLIPAGTMGQTFAMLEALLGQIYLVIVVARLVSLWGQASPRAIARQASGTPEESSLPQTAPGQLSQDDDP
jgi:hypothetical protein